MEYLTELLIFLVTFLVALRIFPRRSRFLPPGPWALPIVGNLPWLQRDNNLYLDMQNMREKYGDIFSFKLGAFQAVVFCGYDRIHEAFVKNSSTTNGRYVHISNIVRATENAGIMLAQGEQWQAMRRFTLTALRDLGFGKKTIEDKILHECSFLNREIEQCVGTGYTNIQALFPMATSNIISILMFGSRFDYTNNSMLKLMEKLSDVFNSTSLIVYRRLVPLFRFIPQIRKAKTVDLFEYLWEFVQIQIREHRDTFDPDNIRDYVDVYLKVTTEGREKITEQSMFHGIVDMFLAGTETSSNTLNWALLYMIELPEIQRRCQFEIDQVVGKNRQVRMSDRLQLPYTDSTIMEVMRHSAILAASVPHRATEDFWIGGYHIPKDCVLFAHIYSALRDPRYWKEADRFWPDRFLDEQGNVKTPNAFIPFSAGPRTCLGETLAKMEMFLFFANMLQQFSFSKVQNTDKWSDKEVIPAPLRRTIPYGLRVEHRL